MSSPTATRRAQAGRTKTGSGHIHGLDGLRAIAVIAVLIYHIWPGALPGGFLGVDVFFVLSGFLITTLILREMAKTRTLNLKAFWIRRARRLLPALFTVVTVTVLGARLIAPDLLVGIGRQVLGALTFSSNWLEIAHGSSYFDQTTPVLLKTLWSLAIEEQFYLMWPLVLLLLLMVVPTWRGRVVVSAAVAFASAIAMFVIFTPGGDPTRVYYGSDTHLFGMLFGVAAAFWWRERGERDGTVPRWAPPAGLALLVALMIFVRDDATFTYRGGLALAALAAVVVVLGSTSTVTPWTRALDAPVLRWVGERSYGIYLWHWPILLITSAAFGTSYGAAGWSLVAVITLTLTFLLSALSFKWIETPVRRLGFREARSRMSAWLIARGTTSPRLAMGAAAVVVLAVTATVLTAPTQSLAQRQVEEGLAALEAPPVSAPVATSSAAPAEESPASEESEKPAPTDEPTDEPSGEPEEVEEEQEPEEPVPAKIEGNQISAFGDSVMSGVAPALLNDFAGIEIDAKPIRTWIDAEKIIRTAAETGTIRDVVVLNFGTNAGFKSEASVTAFRSILDVLGPDRRVVVVNTVGVSYWVPDTNETLTEIVSEFPNVQAVDWWSVTQKNPRLLHNDRTHPNMDGMVAYAKLLGETLNGKADKA